MDPPFGDAFRSHVFSEQTLMSTDLLASSSDPDFMYELVGHLSVCVHASCSLTNTLSSCSNKGVFVQERCRIIRYRLALPREGPSCLASKCNASSVDARYSWSSGEAWYTRLKRSCVGVYVFVLETLPYKPSFLQEQLCATSPKLWMQGKQNTSWLMSCLQ